MAPQIAFQPKLIQHAWVNRLSNMIQRVPRLNFLIFLFALTSSILSAADRGIRSSKEAFSFESVCKVAESKLGTEFSRRVLDLPCELVGLDYDSWRYIVFEPGETMWRVDDHPFQVETGHRGYLFTQRVELNEVNDGRSSTIPFNPHSFIYRNWLIGYRFPRSLGHSGWKLLAKYNDEQQEATKRGEEVFVREVASFLGASYFRVLGSQHVYGSSLRGLAVDCAMPHPEEFPSFTRFWLQRPDANSRSFRCWALLESERVVGAYQFDLHPDRESTLDVRVKLYIRGPIEKLGIAPLTSMWMWGGGTAAPTGDTRSEVHDADGLMVIGSDNSRLWRPLSRPSIPIVNHYSVPGLKAFGLVQRNRDSKVYNDGEASYHNRPTIMIEPKDTWPAGGVELLRLPAAHEGIDNIGAFYLLKDPPQDGESVELEYRIHVCDDDKRIAWKHSDLFDSSPMPRARFIRSKVTRPGPNRWKIQLVADSAGTLLEPESEQELKPEMIALWHESGHLTSRSVTKSTDGIIVELEMETDKEEAFELLLHLNNGQRDLTEVWSYRCEP